ncbi:uncharacterized protein LOC105648491 isoform X2 [Jatropha curcas]|uniref:uncharacterized protein LOC105648491 isoform X2 n=1 Tax=Jatropha curcas TaxID=180498 RepID=UPI0009D657BF|nr:uncharacterized protein LOC105648491 isoform X2 [Jatropha curcas]
MSNMPFELKIFLCGDDHMVGPRSRMDGRTDRKARKLSSHRHDPSQQDQVVPQLENRGGVKDERDPLNVAVASANSN